MICAALLCALYVGQAPESLPSAEEILAGTRQRAQAYVNVRFEYTVRAKYWPGRWVRERPIERQTRIESSDSLTILASDRRDSPRPWLCWTSRLLSSDSSFVDYLFAWSDGLECGDYRHMDDVKEGHLYSSMASIHAGPGPLLFAENEFIRFILCDLNSSMAHVDPDWALSNSSLFKWKVVGRRSWCGRDVLVLRGLYWDDKPDYLEVWVTAAPEYLVVRRESHFVDAQEQYLQEVTALGEHDGLVYPAAGRLVQPEYNGLKRWEYEFTVTSVTRLGAKDRRDWRPAIPEGTFVVDNVRGERYTIPYAPGREQALRQQLARGALQHNVKRLLGGPSRGPAFYFNVALLIVFIMAVLIYRYKRRRQSVAPVSQA